MGVELRLVSCQPEESIANHFPIVGANNHRQFLLFVTTLVIGITLFDYLSYECESTQVTLVFPDYQP